jgi:hypothetical protein
MKALILAALTAAAALSPAQNILSNGDLEADPFNLDWTVLTGTSPFGGPVPPKAPLWLPLNGLAKM